VEHAWDPWQSTQSPCEQLRTCGRCGEAEERIDHQAEGWDEPDEAACVERAHCAACGAWGEETRPAHRWSPWQYSERTRSPVRGCRRCGAFASAIPGHQVDPPPAEAEALAGLRQYFEEQVAAGIIPPERQPFLRSMLAKLERVVVDGADDPQAAAGQIQAMLAQMGGVLAHPSRPGATVPPPAGSRAAVLMAALDALYDSVVPEIASMNLTGDSAKAAGAILSELRDAREALAASNAAGDLTALEVESLRPAATGARRFALRRHLTFAHPVWPGAAVAQDPNAVLYSGGTALRDVVVAACQARRLDVLLPQTQREPASLRWEHVRRCALGVFDLTGPTPADLAAAAYELGMALAAGRPAVVVAQGDAVLPFDVDIEPLRLHGTDGDAEAVAAALDQALYGPQRAAAGNSVAASIAHLRRTFEETSTPAKIAVLDVFKERVPDDPVRAGQLAELALGFLDGDGLVALLPTWAGGYPDARHPTCFHVTAFGPAWAGSTSGIVEGACPPGMAYVRGDRVLAPDILRSIWDDICRATHVVVDLTGLNPNVTIELGMAHVLGRNVLLVSQDDGAERHLRAIAKYRCHRYDLVAPAGPELGDVVGRFLAAPPVGL